MEIPNVSIPKIDIQKINIPIHNPYQVLNVPLPSLKLPGCVRYHRDASPKNTALYNDDPRGTSISCPYGSMPTFEPLLYDRRKIEITEIKQEEKKKVEREKPKYEQKKPKLPKKKEEIKIDPCPPKNPQFRPGDYRNDKKIERLVKWERSPSDGITCVGVWEKVPFRESFIGTPQTLISTTVLGVVAGSSALLAPVIKKVISEIFKKIKKQLTKKKDKVQ